MVGGWDGMGWDEDWEMVVVVVVMRVVRLGGHVFVEIGLFRLTAAMGRVEEIVPWKSLVSLSEGLSV